MLLFSTGKNWISIFCFPLFSGVALFGVQFLWNGQQQTESQGWLAVCLQSSCCVPYLVSCQGKRGTAHPEQGDWPVFKPRAPPEKRLAKAAYLSHHAIVVVIVVVIVGCRLDLGVVWIDHPPTSQLNTAKLKRLHFVCDGSVKDSDCKKVKTNLYN